MCYTEIMNTNEIKYLQKIAWNFAYTGFPIDELFQVGAEAWIKASRADTETDPGKRLHRAAQDAKWAMLAYMKKEIKQRTREIAQNVEVYPDRTYTEPLSAIIKVEQEQIFWVKAARLRPCRRKILRLMKEGYTYKEIANELGWKHEIVRGEVHKSLKFIRGK